MNHTVRALFLILSCLLIATAVSAQDDRAAREAAADRYLAVVPTSAMLQDSFAEVAKELPPDQREWFVGYMMSVVRADRLEAISREFMVRTFTADELNALADFYGSQHGSSAMRKFGTYMAQVMPVIQAEIERAIEELGEDALP